MKIIVIIDQQTDLYVFRRTVIWKNPTEIGLEPAAVTDKPLTLGAPLAAHVCIFV